VNGINGLSIPEKILTPDRRGSVSDRPAGFMDLLISHLVGGNELKEGSIDLISGDFSRACRGDKAVSRRPGREGDRGFNLYAELIGSLPDSRSLDSDSDAAEKPSGSGAVDPLKAEGPSGFLQYAVNSGEDDLLPAGNILKEVSREDIEWKGTGTTGFPKVSKSSTTDESRLSGKSLFQAKSGNNREEPVIVSGRSRPHIPESGKTENLSGVTERYQRENLSARKAETGGDIPGGSASPDRSPGRKVEEAGSRPDVKSRILLRNLSTPAAQTSELQMKQFRDNSASVKSQRIKGSSENRKHNNYDMKANDSRTEKAEAGLFRNIDDLRLTFRRNRDVKTGGEWRTGEWSAESSSDAWINGTGKSEGSSGASEMNRPVSGAAVSDIGDRILDQVNVIRESSSINKSEIRMQLHPSELGELKISVIMKDDRKVEASIVTDLVQTRNIIDAGSEKLAETLLNHGLVLEDLNVAVDNPEQGNDNHPRSGEQTAGGGKEDLNEKREMRPVFKSRSGGVNCLA